MKAKTNTQPKHDEEELEILQALEAGQLKSVADSKKQIKVPVALLLRPGLCLSA